MNKPSHFTLLAPRHSARHPIQSPLLVLGGAGRTMIVAIDLAATAAPAKPLPFPPTASLKATHQIVAAPGNLQTSLYEKLRVELGLREIALIVTGLALLAEANNLPLQILGLTPMPKPPSAVTSGSQGSGLSLEALVQLQTQPNTILLPHGIGPTVQPFSGQPTDPDCHGPAPNCYPGRSATAGR
ncbi:MAG: hypothetical protein U0401_13635 [Anaerolineae bacterium]